MPYTQRDQSDRVFPLRKQYLTHTYEAILSNNNMMLAFLNANVKNAEISAVRRGLQALKGVNSEDEIPRLTVCNAGVFRGIVRKSEQNYLCVYWSSRGGGQPSSTGQGRERDGLRAVRDKGRPLLDASLPVSSQKRKQPSPVPLGCQRTSSIASAAGSFAAGRWNWDTA